MNKITFANSVFCIHLLSVTSLLIVLNTPSVSAKQLKPSSLRQSRTNTTHLLAQISTPAEIIQITGVKINSTNAGFELILETKEGEKLKINSNTEGNIYIANIANAQLQGDSFRQEKPVEGITEVTVVNQDANTIRVTVVGTATAPTVELFDSDEGLIIGLTTIASITELPQQTQTTPEQPTSDTKPDEATAENQQPIELVVTGEQNTYVVERANTATKTDTPLRDIPQSIQVIPRQVIEDQQIVELPEVLRNVSGVVRTYGYAGSTDNYTIRGFTADFKLRNGFRDEGYYSYTDPANIEQVEVLKGPASVLYGQFEPGGVVNYITKQPLFEPYYSAQFRVGSYAYYRPSIDISGPLNTDKTFLYRLNLAYENSGSFRDFVDKELFVAAPSFRYQLGDKTTLNLDYEYLNLNRTFDRGLPTLRESFDLPISRYLGEPSDLYDFNSNKVNLVLEHRFNENLQLRSAFATAINESLRSNVQARNFLLEADGRTLRRRFTEVDEYSENYILQTDLISKFSTGAIKHQLVAGIEFGNSTFGYNFKRTNFPSIDIFNPVYGFPKPTTFTEGFDNKQNTETIGIYLQDQIEITSKLKLLLGGRFDIINYDSKDDADIFSDDEITRISRYYEAFSPRIGIVYQPIQPLSLYASYSRSFKPNFNAITINRQPLEPERGTQYEVGIKGEFLDGRLSTTLAAYQITKSNVATSDPSDDTFSIAAGEVKSRGIELDVAGEILPGWKIIASYALNDAFVSKDNNLPVGDKLVNAPANLASLWTSYQLQQGSLQGLGFGLGLFFVGEREGQLPNDLEIPSYLRTDATIFYTRDRYKLALNFKNLFDTKYYESQGSLLYPGEPFTVYGSISVQF